jgi:hypothetical protein
LNQLALELQLILEDAYRRLDLLWAGKDNDLDALLHAHYRQSLPVGDLNEPDNKSLSFGNTSWKEISTQEPWDSTAYRAISACLQMRNPREQLAAIRHVLHDLRKALLEHFTVEDILLEVGDDALHRWDPSKRI